MKKPKTRKKTRKQMRGGQHKKIALLFLTKAGIMHLSEWKTQGYENANIYIHPKIPGKNSDWNRWEVSNPVATKWGDCSIVEATLLLLRAALQESQNYYFVLCAEDSYPLVSFSVLQTNLLRQNKSMVQCLSKREKKSSQWWMLLRRDAEDLVTSPQLSTTIMTLKKKKTACDEYFLLNTLPQLHYDNRNTHYVKWIEEMVRGVVAKHPTTFRRLLSEDIARMRGCFFIRKTTPDFLPTPPLVGEEAWLIIHGTESPARTLPNQPIFILNLTDNAPPTSPHVVQIFSCVWNQVEPAKQGLVNYLTTKAGFQHVHVLEERARV
jgi:hypothetical protein